MGLCRLSLLRLAMIGLFGLLVVGCTPIALNPLAPKSKVTKPTQNPKSQSGDTGSNDGAPPVRAPGKPLEFKGSISGSEISDIVFNAKKGSRIQIKLAASSNQVFFDLLPPGDGAALYVGRTRSVSNSWSGNAPVSGNYLVRIYQLGSARTGNQASSYALVVFKN